MFLSPCLVILLALSMYPCFAMSDSCRRVIVPPSRFTVWMMAGASCQGSGRAGLSLCVMLRTVTVQRCSSSRNVSASGSLAMGPALSATQRAWSGVAAVLGGLVGSWIVVLNWCVQERSSCQIT